MSRFNPPTLSLLEKAVWIHAGFFLLGSSWLYGGNIWWMQTALSAWGSAGAILTVLAFFQHGQAGRDARRKLVWLIPLALFATLVLVSAANPSYRPVYIDGETSFVKQAVPHDGWPSSMAPAFSLGALWFGAGAYLSALNLALVPQSRLALRGFMVLLAVNTFVLAVFGTLQKLAGSGYYFGAAQSPNPRFFATFIYYNHWGAFMLLGLTTAIGLLFHYARKHEGRDLWHSPFSGALTGVFFIAACAPVSASRASTIITACIMAAAIIHALVLIGSRRRARNQSAWPSFLLIGVLATATTGAVAWLADRSLAERYTETRRTIDQEKSIFGGRAELYRDTWTLAREKPAFGWGLNTYAIGFQRIRPIGIHYHDNNHIPYVTAHNDWLQSVAETGFVGTALLVLMGAVPLLSLPRRVIGHPLVAYPLIGCALVLLYAWVEFPFGNNAVMITFWALFFATLRHAQLTATARHSPGP